MKERPVLMNEWSVRRILAGKKTQTRRVIKPQPQYGRGEWHYSKSKKSLFVTKSFMTKKGMQVHLPKYCPFGEIGDHLWVRETWGIFEKDTYQPTFLIYYPADNESSYVSFSGNRYRELNVLDTLGTKQSIFMPREVSRIKLEITNIRVQRIQNISWADSIKEGIDGSCHPYDVNEGVRCLEEFIDVWNNIHGNGDYDWDNNPWVWVLEFRTL